MKISSLLTSLLFNLKYTFIFLFLLFTLLACSSSPTSTSQAPEFKITSPVDGANLCRYSDLSISSQELSKIASVEFSFKDAIEGTDIDSSDGFTIPFYTKGKPEGNHQLKVKVIGKNGAESTKAISINIISAQNTQEVTQEVFESATGIKFAQRNLRFLGAQKIADLACDDSPISSDYADQVKAGDEIWQWGSLPDKNNDGVQELVIINKGVLNTNGDIVPFTVPDINIIGKAKISSKAKNAEISDIFTDGLSAGAGAIIRVDASGFPLDKSTGTVAVFTSSVNSDSIEVETYFHYDQDYQALIFAMPQLPVGKGQLVIKNDNLKLTSKTINVTFENLPALTRPLAEILNEFYTSQVDLSTLAGENAIKDVSNATLKSILKKYQERQNQALIQTQKGISQLLINFNNLDSETKIALEYEGKAIENSQYKNFQPTANSALQTTAEQVDCKIFIFLDVPCPNANTCTPPKAFSENELNELFRDWLIGDTVQLPSETNVYEDAIGAYLFAKGAAKVVATLFGRVLEGFYYVDNNNNNKCSNLEQLETTAFNSQKNNILLVSSQQKDLKQFSYVGMATLASTSSSGFGGAAVRNEIGTCELQQTEGRTLVSIFVDDKNIAFDGTTNQEGIFSVAGIPEDKRYIAKAIDSKTGQERTFSDVGLPKGQVNFIYFDFCDNDFEPSIRLYKVRQTADFEVTVEGKINYDEVTAIELATVRINDEETVDITSKLSANGEFTLVLPVGVVREINTLNIVAFTKDGRLTRLEEDFADILFLDWKQQGVNGNGEWEIADDGRNVIQKINTFLSEGKPTFFIAPDNYIDVTIRGTIEVKDGGEDDDWIGFTFGYNSPLNGNNATSDNFDLLLFDWKKDNQLGASEGYSLLRIKGELDRSERASCFYRHDSSIDGCEVLKTLYKRDDPKGEGWQTNTPHQFELKYTQNNVQIFIDGEQKFNVDGQFPAGRFGFYNYSQPEVFYSNFTVTKNK